MAQRPELKHPTRLHGRRTECTVLDEILEATRAGESRTLVVRGEAGVGKTALLDYLAHSGSDLRVVRAVGVESEIELPFSALHQLCAPLVDRLGRLAAPQRQALETAFGLSAGAAPDRFFVGLAVLGLLADVAERRPLVCLVDDAQWLDRASALALGFVARRLGAEPVAMIFATRQPSDEFQGLPQLLVTGLRNGDAHALLGSVVRLVVDERVQERLIAETRGNPLALLELPRGLTPTQLPDGFGLLNGHALSRPIDQSLQQRLDELPSETERLLLVAAAEPLGDPLLMWHAAKRLGIGATAAAPAEAARILTIGERVTFRHPLVRSAVYRAAASEDRRSAHLALAEVTDPEADPDRRAWHLAAGTAGPDEEVALELERSAGRARARGGLAAAAAFLQRSVALTGDPARRTERALGAAEASLHAGAFDPAIRLLAIAEAGSPDAHQDARIDLLRGQVSFASGRCGDAVRLLLKAAKQLESVDLDQAREAYLSAWGAAAFADRTQADDLPEVCNAVRALPPLTRDPRPVDVLLDGLALLILEGRTAAAPMLRRATRTFAGDEVSGDERIRWGWLATTANHVLWDSEGTRAICAQQLQLTRDAGALEQLPLHLVALGVADAWSGDFAAASSLVAELDEVTAATGARIPPLAALLLEGLRGRESEASAEIEAALHRAEESGQWVGATAAHWAAAVLYNGLGRYEDAVTAAQQASWDPMHLCPSAWALPELIEAAARLGRDDIAQTALRRLAGTTQPAGTDAGLGIEARSRALLSEGAGAECLYLEAIDRLGRTCLRPELGRAHLVFGEWLRREHRRKDARAQLRIGHEMFTEIGMEAFAERARIELLATGERVRRRTVNARDELTSQEREIARLAREGLSNPEIGLRLFISPRTVEWHLRKVFSKLGIASRRELAGALPSYDRQTIVAQR